MGYAGSVPEMKRAVETDGVMEHDHVSALNTPKLDP